MPQPECCRECKEFIEVHFGFNSRRKYGFLHSSWETVRARKTGSPSSCMDYVVYRLFYTLFACGLGVFTVAQSSTYNIFVFFETWILVLHIIYAFLFLRQVLVHNIFRRALGRGQKMPEELFITDEIMRDGRKYYISKKLSVLQRQAVSSYEKLVWITFNTVASLTMASFLGQSYLFGVLEQCEKEDRVIHLISTFFGVVLIIIDVVSNVLPMRTGHFIHPFGFLLLYFLCELCFDYNSERCTGSSFGDLYRYPTYSYPCCVYLIILTFVAFQIIHAMKMLRDFLITMFDLSRTETVKQRLRAQKRLARRKIMHEIRGPDGNILKITLDHVTPSQEDLICWRENEEEVEEFDWAGDSETDLHNINLSHHFQRKSDDPSHEATRRSDDIFDELKNQLAKMFHKNSQKANEDDFEKAPEKINLKSDAHDQNVTHETIEVQYERGLNVRLPTPPNESLQDKNHLPNTKIEPENEKLDFETGDFKLKKNIQETGSNQEISTDSIHQIFEKHHDSKEDIPDSPRQVRKSLRKSIDMQDDTDHGHHHNRGRLKGQKKAPRGRKSKNKHTRKSLPNSDDVTTHRKSSNQD